MPSCDLRATSLSKDGEAQAGVELPKYYFGKQAGIAGVSRSVFCFFTFYFYLIYGTNNK